LTHSDIWSDLRLVAGTGEGMVARRIAVEGAHEFRLALSSHGGYKSLLAVFDIDGLPDGVELPIAQGFQLTVFDTGYSSDATKLSFELKVTSSMFEEIFDDLVTNLIDSANAHTAPLDGFRAFLSRLDLWKRFASRVPESGLTRSQQIGLYGELWVMRKSILPILSPFDAIEMWQGPNFATQDFQLRGLALEVKTSTHSRPEQLTIASEKQLDPAPWDVLLLTHVASDYNNGAGETLPEIIKSIGSIMDRSNAGVIFFDKLLECGYTDAHEAKYSSHGFSVKHGQSYVVSDNFPSILSSELDSGVGNVSYSVDVAALDAYMISDEKINELLGNL